MINIPKTILILLFTSASICNCTDNQPTQTTTSVTTDTAATNVTKNQQTTTSVTTDTAATNVVKEKHAGGGPDFNYFNDKATERFAVGKYEGYNKGYLDGMNNRLFQQNMLSSNDNINTAISTIFSFAVAPWGALFGYKFGNYAANGIINTSPAVKPYEKYIQGICRGTGMVLGAFTAQQVSYRLTNRIYRAIDARQQGSHTIKLSITLPEAMPTRNEKGKVVPSETSTPTTQDVDIIINDYIAPSPLWATRVKILAPIVICGGIGATAVTGNIRFVQAPGTSSWNMSLGFNVTI